MARLPKNHQLYETIGTIDELSSFLGNSISLPESKNIFKEGTEIQTIQQNLQDMNAHLACDPNSSSDKQKKYGFKGEEQVAWFESWIDTHWKQMPPLTEFILPSGNELTTRYES